MVSGTIESLRTAAAAGDAAALAALGMRLLTGDGVAAAPREGIEHLRAAASRGSGEALARLALLAAWGVLGSKDLPDAFDKLCQAAELGHAPARQELQFLACGAGSDWQALRRSIDVGAWIASPPARALSESPRIRAIEGFASPDECDWIVERGRHGLRRALVYRRDAPGHAEAESRTNSETDFTVRNSDLVLFLVRERIAAAVGRDSRFFEITKLLHYEPGQRFSLHADFQDPATPALAREIALHGQRILTFLVWLNDDYEGGETEFPSAGLRCKGRKGDALFFFNVDGSGAPDYRSVHAGLPPTRGRKWLLSQWIRSQSV